MGTTENNPVKIFTGSFVLLFIANLLTIGIYLMLMTTMAYFAINSYGIDSAIAGLVASIFLMGAVAGRLFSGRYAKESSLKRYAIFSAALQLLMALAYFLGSFSLGILIIIRIFHGFAFGMSGTVLPAIIVNQAPKERIGEVTGYFSLSNSLGIGVGPLMTVFLTIGLDYTVLFNICMGGSLLCLILLLPARYNPPKATASKILGDADNDSSEPSTSFLARIIDLSTVKISMFMFLLSFAFSSLGTFLNNYAITIGMGFYAPFVFLTYSVVLLITRLFTGKIMDKYGENTVLYPSIASMAVGLLVAAFASNPVALLSCGVFMATGFGTCLSVGQAAVIKASRSKQRSLPISTFFFMVDGASGIGPFFLGFAVSGWGYQAMYVLSAFIALGSLVYYHFAHGRKMRKSS